jgi:hypothetical protein
MFLIGYSWNEGQLLQLIRQLGMDTGIGRARPEVRKTNKPPRLTGQYIEVIHNHHLAMARLVAMW